MSKGMKWKAIVTFLVLVGGIVYLVPSFVEDLPEWWKKYLPTDKIHLGLDLRGGIHLLLEVEADKAVENTVERIVTDLKEVLRKKDIFYSSIGREGQNTLKIEGISISDKDRFDEILSAQYPTLKLYSTSEGARGVTYVLGLTEKEAQAIKEQSIDQALETIRNRIDQYGVTEPTIHREGSGRIVVQLPGIKDPERAIELIGKTALLEFKLVDEEHSLEEALKGNVPPESEIIYEKRYDPETNRTRSTPLLIKKRTLMTGDVIADARMHIDSKNQPYVGLKFNPRGAKLFDQIAAENVNKRLAIILDNNVYSAPVIRQTHYGGSAVIEGNFTSDEAHDLAIVLRAGSLPAPIKVAEKRAVGPSLGTDSIRKGLISCLVGGILIIVFMGVYYQTSGIIVNLALIIHMVMIMATMAAFKAVLTLPGIAGLVLTMGMGVDANVLIHERIREELRLGKSFRAAVEAGYKRVLLVIFDANITTLVAALVMFQFGTGPVKGFAVTLSIGVVWTILVQLYFTQWVFEYLLNVRRVKSIRI